MIKLVILPQFGTNTALAEAVVRTAVVCQREGESMCSCGSREHQKPRPALPSLASQSRIRQKEENQTWTSLQMNTESLRICTHKHAQPATCSGWGVAELLPWTRCFQRVRWKSHCTNWPLGERSIQISDRDLNFPKETNEEWNGSPVQPAQLSGCKHTWVRKASRVLGHCTAPCHQLAESQPVLTHEPSPGQEGPWCTPKAAASPAEPVVYPQLQHQWHQEDAALQSQPISFPSSENQRMEEANK